LNRAAQAREPSLTPRLYSLVSPYRRTVAAGLACLVVSVAAELFPPIVWLRVVDVGLARRDWGYIAEQLALLVAALGVGQLFSAVRGLLLERAGGRLTLDLRLRLYRKLQGQSAAYFARHRTGDLLARLTADVESIQDVLVRGTDSVVANGLRLLGVAAVFVALQPALGLLVLSPMVAVGLMLAGYNRSVRPAYRAAGAASATSGPSSRTTSAGCVLSRPSPGSGPRRRTSRRSGSGCSRSSSRP
jgi:ABC-type multidrug transport system fused ATPase/permease subunit